jgi:cobalt/nickel transport system permease protein
MHIPDGILSPAVCVVTGAAAAGAVGYGLRRLQAQPDLRSVPLTAVLAGLVFAGQMVNFRLPLPGVGVSGHLIGGVLAAVIAGPWAGLLAIALVLLIQMLIYADGGWLAYGANVLNMGVIGSLGGYAVFDQIRRRIAGPGGVLIGSVLAAWLSVMAASTLFCVEFLLSSPDFLRTPGAVTNLLALMTTYHSVIGMGEALITGLVLSYVVSVRPDLVHDSRVPSTWTSRAGSAVWTGMIAALVVAAFAAPFASDKPDGLEAALTELKVEAQGEPKTLALSDYAVPIPSVDTSEGTWAKVSVALAGIVGTLLVLIVAYGFGRAVTPRRPPEATVAP